MTRVQNNALTNRSPNRCATTRHNQRCARQVRCARCDAPHKDDLTSTGTYPRTTDRQKPPETHHPSAASPSLKHLKIQAEPPQQSLRQSTEPLPPPQKIGCRHSL